MAFHTPSLHLLCLYYILTLLHFDCVEIESNGSCRCFDPETSILLKNAHASMEQENASTFIVYLNEQNDTEATRQYIHKYFLDSFNLWYSLYDNIKEEHFWDAACHLRAPIGWYFLHTASFSNMKLRMNNHISRADNELYDQYDFLFAQGVDEKDWNDVCGYLKRPKSSWPDVTSTKQYVVHTKDVVSDLILNTPLTSLPINNSMTFWWPIVMGIEHERIHLETSGVLIRHIPLDKFKEDINGIWSNVYEGDEDRDKNIPPPNELIAVKGRVIDYGRSSDLLHDDNPDYFGWDAEYGSFSVNVSDFNASKYMVSNHEYYAFYADNGYLDSEYWSVIGWEWVQDTNTTHPKFWVPHHDSDGGFNLRNTFSETDMYYAWNRPVITNHYEAEAFIAWKSKQLNKSLRIITEDEWHILRTLSEFGAYNMREWSTRFGEFIANTNFYYYSGEAPIDIFELGNSGFYDVVGNLWHHTSTQYHPFNNYEIDTLYVDFSTPFFNKSYYIMKGGSYLSSGNMAMIYNRNQWFRGHYFQAAGIRYVESDTMDEEDINEDKQTTQQYFAGSDESNELVYEYIHFNFVSTYKDIIVDIIDKYVDKASLDNVLDIGCSVGGVAYQLKKKYPLINNIIGIDDRARFIGFANRMQQSHKLRYAMKNAFGEEEYYSVASEFKSDFNYVFDNIRFVHDDDLRFIYGNSLKYDLIIGEKMFERYYDEILHKKAFVLADLLKQNGIMILFEDYEWNKDGIDVMDEMRVILGKDMVLRHEFDTVPITHQVYESSRIVKQYSLHCTVWMKL